MGELECFSLPERKSLSLFQMLEYFNGGWINL